MVADSGIVDEETHALSTRRERGEKFLRLSFIRQIDDVTMHREPRARDFGLQFLQPIKPACHENERACVRGELSRKLAPEAGRSAGDQCGAAVEKLHGPEVLWRARRVTSEKNGSASV